MTYDWWLYPAVASGIGIFQLEARLSHAAWKNRKLIFRFPLLLRLGILGVPGLLIYLLYRDWPTEEWWVNLLGIAMTLWFLLSWPPTVVISNDGIERQVWWKRKVFIPWDQVVDAEVNQNGDMEIIGQEASISCSSFQNDPEQFRKEVISRSKVKKFNLPERIIGLHLQFKQKNRTPEPHTKNGNKSKHPHFRYTKH